MAEIRPITCLRPDVEMAARIATGPHSEISKGEIREKILENPLSYSRIVHPKCLYGSVPDVYDRSADILDEWIGRGVFREDTEKAFYIYRLTSWGHVQNGLVGLTPLDGIVSGSIHAHEKVRENKLADLMLHIDKCRAQVGGPVLMAVRSSSALHDWIEEQEKQLPLYHFVSENGVLNQIWRVNDPAAMKAVEKIMADAGDLYIADGHHRVMASAAICERNRRKKPSYTGKEPWNFLPCVCFSEDELKILPFARIVEGYRDRTLAELLALLSESFVIEACEYGAEPRRKGEFVLASCGKCFRMILKEELRPDDAQASLDVSVLQNLVLEPLFGIRDPKTDPRMEFIGGMKYKEQLLALCKADDMVGFLPYHTSMSELFAVADAGETMPPKSTWFEPKLCNGLFIYRLA